MLDARLARIVDSCAERMRPHVLDAVDLQLISRLEAMPYAAADPVPAFRAGLRTQLLERAPELLVPAPTDPENAVKARGILAVDWRRRWSAMRRPIIAATAVATVFFMLMGTSVWLSKRALPGDALYAVKRASEDARISVTHGDAAKGKKYLQFASDRLEEISKLIGRSTTTGGSKPSSGRISGHIQDLVVSTLATLDRQARDGTTLLTRSAVANGDSAILEPLGPWASTEHDGLSEIADRLPYGRAENAARASLDLVTRVQIRVYSLNQSIGCACMSSVNSDDLGPKPCTECPGQPSTPSSSAATSSTPKPHTPTRPSPTPSTSPSGDGGGTQSAPPPLPPATPPTEPPTSDPSSTPGDTCTIDCGGTSVPTSDPTTDAAGQTNQGGQIPGGGATTQAAQTES
jgi:hypothetical protein